MSNVSLEARHAPTTCFVSGANGFVAQHVVRLLLAAGHRVRGTVRNTEDAKHAFLFEIEGANERLTLHSADLSDAADHFKPIVDGCEFVFHVASPYVMDYKDGQKELVEPAVQGTLSVLEAASRCASVRRVVLTSSIAAILDAPKAGHTFSEDDWNTTFASGDYYRSKAEAERAAWTFAGENGMDLVTVNPFMVIGPTLADQHNTSSDLLVSFCSGGIPVIGAMSWGFVSVLDTAMAHLQAAFVEEAKGRFLVSSDVLTAHDVVEILRRQFPQYASKLPKFDLDCKFGAFVTRMSAVTEKNKGTRAFLRAQVHSTKDHPLLLDNSKSTTVLHLDYQSSEDAIVASVKNSVRWGHL